MALSVKTKVDGSGFARGLEKMEQDAQNFGKNLSGKVAGNFSQAFIGILPGLTGAISGAFAADKIKTSLMEFAKAGEDIKYGAIRLNVDEDTYQRVDRVMKLVGQSADTAAMAFDKLAVAETNIEKGGAEALKLRQAFAELGVTGDDLAKQDYQAIFFKIAEGMKTATPTKEQVAALRDIYGRGGDNLLPAFKVGFDSEYAKAGVIQGADLAAAKNFSEEMRTQGTISAGWWNSIKGFAASSAAGLMFALNPFRWAQEAGTTGETSIEAKFGNAQARRLAEMLAEKQRAAALQEHLHAEAAKFDKEDSKRAAAIDRETAALRERNLEASMTPEEKRLRLLQQIASMQGELNYGGGDLSKADEAGLRKKIEEANGALGELDRSQAKIKTSVTFERLGNTAIGGVMLGHGVLDKMEAHLMKIAGHTGSIDHKTSPAGHAGPGRKEFP